MKYSIVCNVALAIFATTVTALPFNGLKKGYGIVPPGGDNSPPNNLEARKVIVRPVEPIQLAQRDARKPILPREARIPSAVAKPVIAARDAQFAFHEPINRFQAVRPGASSSSVTATTTSAAASTSTSASKKKKHPKTTSSTASVTSAAPHKRAVTASSTSTGNPATSSVNIISSEPVPVFPTAITATVMPHYTGAIVINKRNAAIQTMHKGGRRDAEAQPTIHKVDPHDKRDAMPEPEAEAEPVADLGSFLDSFETFNPHSDDGYPLEERGVHSNKKGPKRDVHDLNEREAEAEAEINKQMKITRREAKKGGSDPIPLSTTTSASPSATPATGERPNGPQAQGIHAQ